jgi:hypothetical protein
LWSAWLGKPTLYQLSYARKALRIAVSPGRSSTWFAVAAAGYARYMEDDRRETQQGQPSGTNPARASKRLELEWIMIPLAVAVVVAIAFGLKAAL